MLNYLNYITTTRKQLILIAIEFMYLRYLAIRKINYVFGDQAKNRNCMLLKPHSQMQIGMRLFTLGNK